MAQWGQSGNLWAGGVAEAVYPAYHVILGGVGLLVTPGGYERRLGQRYAAKLSTAGTTQQDRLNDQLILLDNWHGGEGYLKRETETPDRYRAGSGIDPYTEEGAVALGPYLPTVWSSSLNGLSKLCAGGAGELFIGTSAGLIYTYTSGTPSLDYTTGKAGGITSLTRGLAELVFAGTGTDGQIFRHTTGSGWASLYTLTGTVTGVHSMRTHWKDGTQWLYLGADNDGGRSIIFYSDGGTAYATAMVLDEPRATVMLNYGDDLVIAGADPTLRKSSIYTIDNTGAQDANFDFRVRQEGAVLQCGAVLGDYAYFGDKYGGRIWRWDGDKLTLYHQLGTPAVPYTAELRGMVAYQGALWISILDTDGTVALLRFDGNQSWSRPVTGLTGTTPEDVAEYNGQLYLLTSATSASKLRGTDGTFGGSGNVESSLIDADLSSTDKLWQGITVRHSALAATQSVEVQYKLEDTGSWVSLGTSDTDGETSADFDFPSAIAADLIAFKLILTGTAGSSTALKVYSLSARYLPSPGAGREWTMRVQLYGTDTQKMVLADGSSETLTGEEISDAVWALVDAVEPVTLVDIDRQEYTVQITEWSSNIGGRWPNVDPLDSGWQQDGQLRLTEV